MQSAALSEGRVRKWGPKEKAWRKRELNNSEHLLTLSVETPVRRLSCFRWTYFLGALCINDSTDYATVWDCQATSRQHAAHFAYPAAGCALGMGQGGAGVVRRLTNAFCRLHSQSNAQHAAIKSERKVFWTIVMPNEKSKCPTIVPRHLATDAIEQKRNRVNERETVAGEGQRERKRKREPDRVRTRRYSQFQCLSSASSVPNAFDSHTKFWSHCTLP